MGTLILDKDEQKYTPKEIEKAIQKLRRDWRMRNWDLIEDDIVHVHISKV